MNPRLSNAGAFLLFFLLLLLLSGLLLYAPALAQSTGGVRITVTDDWLSHLENSSVYLDGSYQGMTDRYGHLTIQDLTPGVHNITVARDGYANKSIEQALNGTEPLNFKLEPQKPANAVTIVVLDARVSRSMIAGANVSVDGKLVGQTDSGNGAVVIDLAPGLHTVNVTKELLDDNTTQIDVVPGGTYTILMGGGDRRYNIFDTNLFVYSLQKEIANGLIMTLELSLISYAIGICIGLFMGIGRASQNLLFRGIASVYVEGVRGIPLLLQLLLWNFGMPVLITAILASDFIHGFSGVFGAMDNIEIFLLQYINYGLSILGWHISPFLFTSLIDMQFNIDAFWACILALSINSGAYMGEIFKAGIEAINKGQIEAARSLGMTQNQSLAYIILPQAFKIVLPPLGNEFIALIKDSSIGLVISVTEVTMYAKLVGVQYYNTFTPLLAAGIIYLCITIPLGKLVQYMEKRFSVSNTRTNARTRRQKPARPQEETT